MRCVMGTSNVKEHCGTKINVTKQRWVAGMYSVASEEERRGSVPLNRQRTKTDRN
jgi:hypothetical protein